ncbi:cell wall metabolism sensor histidine kinase WalK [Candidatus Poribacteria bacterium]|nr:cell wall metabolism sensor histidine kinase WalK [Candidatus Poribacteria bacterium]
MNIRTQLTFRYIGIMLLVLLAMYFYLATMLKDSMSSHITSELEIQATLTREFLTEELPTQDNFTYDLIDPLVDRLGKANNARVTFIDLDGVVWGDTERDGQALRDMDDHLTRPEVQDAIKNGSGIRDRYSETTKTEFRYFALPIHRTVGTEISSNGERTVIGICRVALPMEAVNTAIGDLRQMALIASVAGLILAIVFSVFSTGAITKPIEKLTQMTQSLAAGNISSRVPADSSNELGQLSQNFNLMADRIQEQIDKISEEHRRSATILTNMGEGVLLVNGASEITYANPTAISMLELPAVYIGKALIEINRIPELQALLKKAEQTETVAFAEIQLGNLREPEAEVTVVPVSAGQEYVIVIHDVTKERQLERIRADFVANVSHELRTPLTTIRGYAETLLSEDSVRTKTGEQFIVKILNHSARLTRLVSDLLELSRLELGEVELKRSSCHLHTFYKPILEVFEPLLEESGLVLEWEISEAFPEVNVDRQLFMQIFVNLIDNAIKYTPDGGTLTVSAQICSSERTEGSDTPSEEIVLSVEDTGIGIPMESQSRVFERFYRVDEGRAREMGGTGLGLAIAKHIALSHNGRIWLESTLGQGSIFHVALPL